MGRLSIGMLPIAQAIALGLFFLLPQLTAPALAKPTTQQQFFSAKSTIYQFSEVAPPGPGSAQVLVYRIVVSKARSSALATIDVEGFQTTTFLTARVKSTGKNRIGFFFTGYRPGNRFQLYQPGDLLLELQTLPNRKIKVIFHKLRSLYENRQEYIPQDLQINQ